MVKKGLNKRESKKQNNISIWFIEYDKATLI